MPSGAGKQLNHETDGQGGEESRTRIPRQRRRLDIHVLLWPGISGVACSALAGLVIMLLRPRIGGAGAASGVWAATASAIVGVTGITATITVACTAFSPSLFL
ncbi:hypothetical protein T484DRAFT_1909516 [Baffinella frigidus]|nr:hypothetical protein T484DRAFT_1909516 [Cryptophyta sp. CCMP2293]